MQLNLDQITRHAHSQIKDALARVELAEKIATLDLPDEAQIGYYDLGAGEQPWLQVQVRYLREDGTPYYGKDCERLPWAQRVKPIGQIMRAFHAHDIERSVRDYGSVSYSATGSLGGQTVSLHVDVASGGISPLCKVETIETREWVTHSKVVVTCPEPSGMLVGARDE